MARGHAGPVDRRDRGARLIVGLLPRGVAWTGLVIAGIAELTTLVLIWPGLSPLLPVARFTGLVWLIVAGALLPLRRRNRHEAQAGVQ